MTFVEFAVEQGNVGPLLEFIADAELSNEKMNKIIASALRNRATYWDEAATEVISSWHGWKEAGAFEKNRANALRKLAERLSPISVTPKVAK